MIAYLGTGLLGAGFVRAMRRRGEEVNVWNRSPAKAKALEEAGAKAFANAVDAVRGATRVHITVSDDAAVDGLLAQIEAGLSPNTIIIDHTTTAPVPTGERIRLWSGKGFRFQHAPVFMGPQNALDGTGSMLVSGNAKLIAELEPILKPMTGNLVNLGDDPVRAASVKLMGNLFMIGMTGAMADMFTLGAALNVPPDTAAGIFGWFNPGAMAPARAERMMHGDLSKPSWTLDMARKDARLMIESARREGAELNVIAAVAADMDRWIANGHGGEDWMVIGTAGARQN